VLPARGRDLIIHGVRVPLVLRKGTEYRGFYQLVGHYYLQGVMLGGALEMGLEAEQVTLV